MGAFKALLCIELGDALRLQGCHSFAFTSVVINLWLSARISSLPPLAPSMVCCRSGCLPPLGYLLTTLDREPLRYAA